LPKARGSPPQYHHLLQPKAGGVAYVLGAMGEALHAILDATIAYPYGRPSFADLLNDRVLEVRVHVLYREIPADLVGMSFQNDAATRERAYAWINSLWAEKDARLASMLTT
jgi:hypothetical protein